MKKVIISIALVLVSLIPTYILIFQAVRTAVPDATLDGVAVTPAYVRWSLSGGEEDGAAVSPDEKRANKKFEAAEPLTLTDLTDVARLSFSPAPERVRVAIYNLTQENTFVGFVSLEELKSHELVGTTDRLQVIVIADWRFSSIVSARAAYSFEVKA